MKNFITLLLVLFACTAMSQSVYVTESGKCFHNSADCASLSKSQPSSVDSVTAVGYGLTPCKKCYKLQTSTTTGTDSGEKTLTGKTIYIGPKGGKYWVDDTGNKHYLPKS